MPRAKDRPIPDFRRRLLAWYDAHARALPWRVGPADHARGMRQDPYKVWLSEVMLQQTTVPHATPYFLDFTRRWPTINALAAAPGPRRLPASAHRRPRADAVGRPWRSCAGRFQGRRRLSRHTLRPADIGRKAAA